MDQPISARRLDEFRAFAEELTALASAAVRAQIAHPSVEIKSDGSPVTAVDLAVEQVLRERIPDCVGTSHRQGALSVTSIELLEEPPDGSNPGTPWPMWPVIARSSSSHDEGGDRKFAMMTKKFSGVNGRVESLHGAMKRFNAAIHPRKFLRHHGEFSVAPLVVGARTTRNDRPHRPWRARIAAIWRLLEEFD